MIRKLMEAFKQAQVSKEDLAAALRAHQALPCKIHHY